MKYNLKRAQQAPTFAQKNSSAVPLIHLFSKHFDKAAKMHTVEEDEETPDIKARLDAFLKEQKDKEKWRELTVKSMDSFKNHLVEFFDSEQIT